MPFFRKQPRAAGPFAQGQGDVAADSLALQVQLDEVANARLATAPTVGATPVTVDGVLAADRYARVDATAGNRVQSLPTGQPEGTVVGVEKVDATGNTVSVAGNIRGVAATDIKLSLKNETLILVADAAGSWYPIASHKTKTSLDALYGGAGTPVVVCRRLPTDSWTVGASTTVADFPSIRAVGRVVQFQSPDAAKPNIGTGVADQQGWDSWLAFPAPAFDPATVPGLLYYWNANSVSAADGTAVASLPATVGGAPLAQGTITRQPTVQTTAGGNRVIRFAPDGTATNDDDLTATITAAAQPVTVAIVHSIGGTVAQQILDAGVQILTSTTQLQAFAGSTLSKTLTLPDALGVTVAVFDTTTRLYRNGGTPATGSSGATGLSATFRIGRHGSAGRPLTGDIGAVTVHAGALTAAQVQTLGAGLASQYSTAAAWAAVTG